MGRGRAKAKQAKVARELKYSAPETDLEALRRELSSQPTNESVPDADEDTDGEEDYRR